MHIRIFYEPPCIFVHSGSSAGDLGDVTPCNASPNLPGMLHNRMGKSDVLDNWNSFVQSNNLSTPANCLQFFHHMQRLVSVSD